MRILDFLLPDLYYSTDLLLIGAFEPKNKNQSDKNKQRQIDFNYNLSDHNKYCIGVFIIHKYQSAKIILGNLLQIVLSLRREIEGRGMPIIEVINTRASK